MDIKLVFVLSNDTETVYRKLILPSQVEISLWFIHDPVKNFREIHYTLLLTLKTHHLPLLSPSFITVSPHRGTYSFPKIQNALAQAIYMWMHSLGTPPPLSFCYLFCRTQGTPHHFPYVTGALTLSFYGWVCSAYTSVPPLTQGHPEDKGLANI